MMSFLSDAAGDDEYFKKRGDSAAPRAAETLTFQLGSVSNFAGVHFWNLDAANYFNHAGADEVVDETTRQGHQQLYHETAENCYYPILVAVDEKNSAGAWNPISGRFNRGGDEEEEAREGVEFRNHGAGSSCFRLDAVEQEAVRRHPYSLLPPIDEDVTMADAGACDRENTSSPLIPATASSAPPVSFWSDYLQVPYLPGQHSCFFERPKAWDQNSGTALDGAGSMGENQQFSNEEKDAILDEMTRKWFEKCDRVDTVHLFCDTGSAAYAQLGIDVLQYVKEEQPKVCTVGFECFRRGAGRANEKITKQDDFHWQDVGRARFFYQTGEAGNSLLDCFFPTEIDHTVPLFDATADFALGVHAIASRLSGGSTCGSGSSSSVLGSASAFWRSFPFVNRELLHGFQTAGSSCTASDSASSFLFAPLSKNTASWREYCGGRERSAVLPPGAGGVVSFDIEKELRAALLGGGRNQALWAASICGLVPQEEDRRIRNSCEEVVEKLEKQMLAVRSHKDGPNLEKQYPFIRLEQSPVRYPRHFPAGGKTSGGSRTPARMHLMRKLADEEKKRNFSFVESLRRVRHFAECSFENDELVELRDHFCRGRGDGEDDGEDEDM